MDEWKLLIGKLALEKGIIKDPNWLDKLDEPMPVWAVLEMAVTLIEALEPTYKSYD